MRPCARGIQHGRQRVVHAVTTCLTRKQEFTVLLVSDATGQMATDHEPGTELWEVPLRANSILMSRVRDGGYRELKARRQSSLIREFMFVHLKKGLETDPVDWMGCDEPFDASDESRRPDQRGNMTTYGVRKDVQKALAAVRTDLDSFTDMEAYALMLSGYRMAEREFAENVRGIPVTEHKEAWRFLAVTPSMDRDYGSEAEHVELLRILHTGKYRAWKYWRLANLWKPIIGTVVVMSALLLLGGLWLSWQQYHSASRVLLGFAGVAGIMTVVPLLVFLVVSLLLRLRGIRKGFSQVVIGLAMGTVGFLLAKAHLHFVDWRFLRMGRMQHGVAAFTGHMTDAPGRQHARFPEAKADAVREQIANSLNALDIREGFSSAARGSDILFVEELLKRGGKAHVYLPFPREHFMRTSVGQGWDEQFHRLLNDPDVDATELSSTTPPDDEEAEAYDRCNKAIQEAAIRFAKETQLKTNPVLLAVWNGNPGDGKGGTADAVNAWQQQGYPFDLIDLRAV
jgi:hypothetical protein